METRLEMALSVPRSCSQPPSPHSDAGEAGSRAGCRRAQARPAPTWRESHVTARVAGRPAPRQASREDGTSSFLGWVQADTLFTILLPSLSLTGLSRGNSSWGTWSLSEPLRTWELS